MGLIISLVDCRFAGHLGDKEWFKELPSDREALPPWGNRPIAVICLTSHRSPIAAQQLAKAGFTKVYNVDGGMLEWNRLGLPKK